MVAHNQYDSSLVYAALNTDSSVDTPVLWNSIFQYSARENLRALNQEFRPQFVISSS